MARPRLSNVVTTCLRLLALCLPVLAANDAVSAQQDPISKIERIQGPLYSASDLRSRDLLGLRLGMAFEAAQAIVVERGFSLRSNDGSKVVTPDKDQGGGLFWGIQDGDTVGIGYAKTAGGRAVVSSIEYMQHLSAEQEKEIEEHRVEIINRYGTPSWWQRYNDDGKIRDRMVYVSSSALRDDEYSLQHIWSCHVNWACQKILNGIDCRRVLTAAREPTIEISFANQLILYRWEDNGLTYAPFAKNRAFQRLDTRGQSCPIPPAL